MYCVTGSKDYIQSRYYSTTKKIFVAVDDLLHNYNMHKGKMCFDSYIKNKQQLMLH